MNYPSNIKKEYHKNIDYKNRGMKLEALINQANNYYISNDIAIIYKKPTPIGVVNVDFKNDNIINKAYFKEPSTLDYNGIYKGKYIEFDAKECSNNTSFPIKNVHKHQIKHMTLIIKHGGITFLIIAINNNYYLYKGEDFLDFIKNETRKSIPFEEIKAKGYEIKYNYLKGIDYIKELVKAYEGVNTL